MNEKSKEKNESTIQDNPFIEPPKYTKNFNQSLNAQLNQIPGMNPQPQGMRPSSPPQAIDFNKIKDKLEDFRKKLTKKYNFIRSLSILPAAASPIFEEDELIPQEVYKTNPLYLMILIPEEQYKNIPKIKPEIIKLIKETGENIWVLIKTEVDLWNYGLDSKFDMIDAISGSFPLQDNGFLGALRIASIHKSLVLRKFEKYVASYVIAGSLVRGTAGKDSDVDVFVVIDDTDVKRIPRIELLEKLRGIIHDYIREATELSGVRNILNVQVYLLTDFWQSVKDAHPVMFTFIRDGIPLHDRGTFLPWKLLLKMGKIKPSPEAIDLFMKQGDQTDDFVKRRLIDAMIDIYWGIVTPTQAMMMLAGEAPPVPKTIVNDVKESLVKKNKFLNENDLKLLEKIVGLYKSYEYGKLKEIPGKEVDSLLKESREYNKMLKKLRTKIEKKMSEKSLDELFEEAFNLLKTFFGNKSQKELINDFEKKMVKKGKIVSRHLKNLKDLANIKKKIKEGKLDTKQAENIKKDAIELIDSLVEYGQRVDLVSSKKGAMQVIFSGNRKGELVLFGKTNFFIEGKEISKIEKEGLESSTNEEFEKAFNESKGKLSTQIPVYVFEVLKKSIGNFELVI